MLKNKAFLLLKKIGFETIWRHITFAHRNGKGDPHIVQAIILNAIDHYQGKHNNCISEICAKDDYERVKIVDPREIAAFTTFITNWSRFKSGKVVLHCWGLSNSLCESIHNMMIKYAPKRIVFGKTEYDMRIAFAIIDYTENLKNKRHNRRTYVWQDVLKARYFQKMQR